MTIYALLNGAKEVVGLFSSLTLAQEHQALLADRDVELIEEYELDALVGSVRRYQWQYCINIHTGEKFWNGGQPVVERDPMPERVTEHRVRIAHKGIEGDAGALVGTSYISTEAARDLAVAAFKAQKHGETLCKP